MRYKGSNSWNTFLCNRLTAIETNINSARAVRLAVITVAAALITIGKYLFDIPFWTIYWSIVGCFIWYLLFTCAFFYIDSIVKKYEDLILKNLLGKLCTDEICQEYMKIKKLENEWYILILRGRFLRNFYKIR